MGPDKKQILDDFKHIAFTLKGLLDRDDLPVGVERTLKKLIEQQDKLYNDIAGVIGTD